MGADTFQPIGLITTNGLETAIFDYPLPINCAGTCVIDIVGTDQSDTSASIGAVKVATIFRQTGDAVIVGSVGNIFDQKTLPLALASADITVSGINLRITATGVLDRNITWFILGRLREIFPDETVFNNRIDKFAITKVSNNRE